MSKNNYAYFKVAFLLFSAICLTAMPALCTQSIAESSKRCIELLLPSLFPMMVISSQMAQFAVFPPGKAQSLISKLTGIPPLVLPMFLIGLMCGYPLPAVLCAEKVRSGHISENCASYTVAVSNGASPAFLIFCVGEKIYGSIYAGVLLYLSQIIASLICVRIISCPKDCGAYAEKSQTLSLSDSIKNAVSGFLSLCGFVVFFSLAGDMAKALLCFFNVSEDFASVISGVFEISSAVFSCGHLVSPLKELFICVFCAVGGMSVICQIRSVTHNCGINLWEYIRFRLCTGCLMAVIFSVFLKIFPFPLYN